MNSKLLLIFACAVVCTYAYWGNEEDEFTDDLYDRDLETFSAAKRRHVPKLSCMTVGKRCVKDSKYNFAQCCPRSKCMCNIWKMNCHCRVSLL